MNTAPNPATHITHDPAFGMNTTSHLSFLDPEYAESHDRRILIVDDEESVRNFFAAYLGETYSCQTAANAQEALEILARESFALVITDIQMPGLSGIELLRKITEHYKDTAVIVASGIDRTQRVMDAIRVGASDYLLKPCDLDVLANSVERALERRMLLRNARRYKQDLEHRNIELAGQKTEMERLQAQVLQAEKMASLGQLAAGVAHELNNPAGFIYSNIDLLKGYVERLENCLSDYDQLDLPPEASARISAIKKACDYDNIIADLLAAEAALPDKAAQYGRADKPAAQYLLAEVYLTRRNQSMASFLAEAMVKGAKAVVLVGQNHVDGLDALPFEFLNKPDWGTMPSELARLGLKAFSLTLTGGVYTDAQSAVDDRDVRRVSYAHAAEISRNGRPAYTRTGETTGLYHAGGSIPTVPASSARH